ncbi:hypothetical protein C8J57DRAFT_1280860 [Mycena rebaudengoi]|nr:hypothetical protein C8J57DRAFT_1280860 [Mycena rebaudengoi]
MPPRPTGPVNLGQLTSPVLIGGLLNFLLFGTLTAQVYLYSICFPHDRRVVKALVYSIYLTMLVCLFLDAVDMHFWFGAGFGDLDKFAKARYSGVTSPIIGSLVGLCVQFFFAYRISMFRQAVLFSGVVALISLMQAAGGIGGGITLYIADSGNIEVLAKNVSFIYMWLIGSAVADVLIAAAMTYLLMNTAEPGTHHIVKRVVRLIIETNTLTALVAILGVILFAGSGDSTYFLCPTMALPGIYANTLLVVLNNRASPSRNPPQRTVPPNTNNISPASDTTAHAHAPNLPRSLHGYGAEEVPMRAMSLARGPLDRSPSMSLDNALSSLEYTRSTSPLRPPFQPAHKNNHPTVNLGRDFADQPYTSGWH